MSEGEAVTVLAGRLGTVAVTDSLHLTDQWRQGWGEGEVRETDWAWPGLLKPQSLSRVTRAHLPVLHKQSIN